MNKEALTDIAVVIIISGAFSGAVISASRKLTSIRQEPEIIYSNETFEPPIQAIYTTCRIAVHAGLGALIAGTAAITAPVSIPIYCLWKSNQHPPVPKE
jgi:hypothetical protein